MPYKDKEEALRYRREYRRGHRRGRYSRPSQSVRVLLAMMISEPQGKCWIWPGQTRGLRDHRRGYIRLGGKKHATHRFAYELVHGAIPEGLELDHLCRTGLCFNPAHLEPVTHFENCRRRNAAEAVQTTEGMGSS